MDVLSDILRSLKLRGTVYFRADFQAPWGMEVPSTGFANFHIVAAGACWLREASSREPVRMKRGDVVLFPRGAPHALLSAPDAETAAAASVLEKAGAGEGEDKTLRFGGDGPRTTLICGHFDYDRSVSHPLFETLPEVLRIHSGETSVDALSETAASLAAAESRSRRLGSAAVVDRLAEVLLVETLRAYLETSREPPVFLAALQDAAIGKALARLHEQPSRSWTVESLARCAGLSRTVFAHRFRRLVDEAPMRYLARWRLLLARDLLAETELGTAEIASRVGYRSEFAFAKAFKRQHGQGPGAFRRTGRQDLSSGTVS